MVDTEVLKNYLNNSLNKDSYPIFANLLSLSNSNLRNILNLLTSYRINITDIIKIGTINDTTIVNFINSLEKDYTFPEVASYFMEDDSFEALDYLMETLNIRDLLVEYNYNFNEVNNSNLESLSKDILFGLITEGKGFYTNRSQLAKEMRETVIPRLPLYTDMANNFPINETNIRSLFQGSDEIKDKFYSIYTEIFNGKFITESFHLSSADQAYIDLFFNSQVHKSYIKSQWFFISAIFRHKLLSSNLKTVIKKLHFELVQKGTTFTLAEINSKIDDFLNSTSFNLNFSNKLTYLLILNHIRKYLTTNSSLLDEYNIFENNIRIITTKVNLLKDFIVNFEQLSNKYLNV